ncbi:MAG: hypothetical protein ACPK85_14390 [Methanosarcina sp.]
MSSDENRNKTEISHNRRKESKKSNCGRPPHPKDGVFVTLCAPNVIKIKGKSRNKLTELDENRLKHIKTEIRNRKK